jgi:hypothetical protein
VRVGVTAFLLGAAAVGALAFGAALVVVVLAEASGRDALRVALAGVEVLSFERRSGGSTTTFGSGLVLLPFLGGLANALAATVLHARGRSAP